MYYVPGINITNKAAFFNELCKHLSLHQHVVEQMMILISGPQESLNIKQVTNISSFSGGSLGDGQQMLTISSENTGHEHQECFLNLQLQDVLPGSQLELEVNGVVIFHLESLSQSVVFNTLLLKTH